MTKKQKKQYIDKARFEYQKEGSIEIDDGAKISRADDENGAYVEAWVWVYDEEDMAEDNPTQS